MSNMYTSKQCFVLATAVLALALAPACRDSGGDDADAGPAVDGGADGNSIQSVQSADTPIGTAVTLRGVVIVAIDTYGARVGALYVMEPEGGAYSGVIVEAGGTAAAGFAVGDLIDIEGGEKDEFTLETDPCERSSDCSITQVTPADGGVITLTKVGDGTVPEPTLVNPWDLATDDSEAEKWEGVLIKFENVSALSAPFNVTSTDDTLKEMEVTGPFRVSSSLTELADTITRDFCYQEITGIGDYFFSYKLLPRSAADLGGEGSSCPAQEEGATDCADDADNDYDGFTDCADFSCQESVAACTLDATVVEVQSDVHPQNAAVSLTEVVVTAIDRDRISLWVQDEGVTAAHNGIYVFRGEDDDDPAPDALDANIQVGQRVNITGKVADYYGSTQIDAKTGTVSHVAGGAATIIVFTDADSTTLGTLATGAPWEGSIVRFTDIALLAEGDYGQITIGSAGNPLTVDDSLYSYNPLDDGTTCFTEITGVVMMNTYDDFYYLAPRDADDIAEAASCSK